MASKQSDMPGDVTISDPGVFHGNMDSAPDQDVYSIKQADQLGIANVLVSTGLTMIGLIPGSIYTFTAMLTVSASIASNGIIYDFHALNGLVAAQFDATFQACNTATSFIQGA